MLGAKWADRTLFSRSVESIAIVSECRRISTLTIHSYIFSCDRLVSLNLVRCFIPALLQPGGGFASFPVLKELYLTCVDFGESHLQAIIRASPMLRVLLLDNVYLDADMDCVIEAPNLHNLTLISCTDDWRFGELPHLQCACINVPHYLWGGTADFVECLTGVSQARELILYLPTLCDFKMDAIPFTVSNLKSMELSTDFTDMHRILLMFCLLRSSPNLEKLKIELLRPETVANRKFLNAQWTDGMCANLKVIQINSYKGWLPLSFIELILSQASLLRILSVDACPVSQDDRLNELPNCRRASPQAQVLFKVQLEKIRFDRVKFAEKTLN